MRSWDARNEEDETPALQRLYAYGIKNAKNRTDFIHFLVGYAERAPYDEELLSESTLSENAATNWTIS